MRVARDFSFLAWRGGNMLQDDIRITFFFLARRFGTYMHRYKDVERWICYVTFVWFSFLARRGGNMLQDDIRITF